MNNNNPIESIKVPAGKRTYFFDVKENNDGSKFLKISESKRLESGEYERHNIMILNQDIFKFFDAMEAVLKNFSEKNDEENNF